MENIDKQKLYYFPNGSDLIIKDINFKDVGNKSKEVKSQVIAVFGATGGSGKQIIKYALERGHKVIAAVRNPSLLEEFKEKIDIRKIDINSVDSIVSAIKDADVIVSALGTGNFFQTAFKPTTIHSVSAVNIIDAMKKCNKKRVLFMTSTGVDYEKDSFCIYQYFIRPCLVNMYMDMMKMEMIVEYRGHDLDWTIIRPSQLFDNNTSKDFMVSNKFVENGTYKINRCDVGKFVINEIENNLWIKKYPSLSYAVIC